MKRNTIVSIVGDGFFINNRATYAGKTFNGMKIEGLLLNSRMVQGIFDDLNPQTHNRWDYPDGPWDPDRNTDEFIAAMPTWRRCGLLSFTINLQGGSPEGYSEQQPWINSAFEHDGHLRNDYMNRLERILQRADELGMAAILGLFYFGQDQRISDEAAVIRAVENVTDWLLEKRYTNVLIEICNEADILAYKYEILRPSRVGELVKFVQDRSSGQVDSPASRLLVSVSFSGGNVPPENVVTMCDFILLHGNGVENPDGIREMVDQVRATGGYKNQPIVFNEDDHYDFDKDDNNFLAAISRHASWGYFDYRQEGEGFDEGYQCIPCNWSVSSARKRAFFELLARVTSPKTNEE